MKNKPHDNNSNNFFLKDIWAPIKIQDLSINPQIDIVDGPFGSNLKATEYQNNGIPIIRLQNIERNCFINKNIKYISKKKSNELIRHSFNSGDIVITKLGAPLGKACIVPDTFPFGVIVADVVRVRVTENIINKKLLVYIINSDAICNQLKIKTKGTTRPRVNLNHIRELQLPLPPLAEQRQIVTRIEELFSKLDAGVEALKKIKTEIKRYRQSVLKSTFEGRLTTEWREKHRDELEPAEVLLERIRKERRKKWEEEQLSEMKAKGKTPKDSKWKEKYKEPQEPDVSGLPELPEGWEWVKVETIGEVVTGTTPSKKILNYYGDDFPFYKPTDLNNGYYVNSSEDGLSIEGIKFTRFLPERSIAVTCIGATIGKTGLIRKAGASNQQINSIIPFEGIVSEFIYFVCVSQFFQKSILNNSSSTTLPILNKSKFEILKLPLPPLAEQHAIVTAIEHRFSIADQVEKTVDHALKQSERLRQSILKKAFEGRLTEKWRADHPELITGENSARALLERIKAEKAKVEAERKTGGRNKSVGAGEKGKTKQ